MRQPQSPQFGVKYWITGWTWLTMNHYIRNHQDNDQSLSEQRSNQDTWFQSMLAVSWLSGIFVFFNIVYVMERLKIKPNKLLRVPKTRLAKSLLAQVGKCSAQILMAYWDISVTVELSVCRIEVSKNKTQHSSINLLCSAVSLARACTV